MERSATKTYRETWSIRHLSPSDIALILQSIPKIGHFPDPLSQSLENKLYFDHSSYFKYPRAERAIEEKTFVESRDVYDDLHNVPTGQFSGSIDCTGDVHTGVYVEIVPYIEVTESHQLVSPRTTRVSP